MAPLNRCSHVNFTFALKKTRASSRNVSLVPRPGLFGGEWPGDEASRNIGKVSFRIKVGIQRVFLSYATAN